MIRYVLLDLDDTLLINSMETFIPPYFKALADYLAPYVQPHHLLPALQVGTDAMQRNTDPSVTLEQVFDSIFYPALGIRKDLLQAHIISFYERVFPSLAYLTQELPAGKELVDDLQKAGYRLVIATNSLFPKAAVLHRLAWAGLSEIDIPYELIASYEIFHFAKPYIGYYQDILNLLQVKPEECVMVGNDLEMDIYPAIAAGIQAYHVCNATQKHVAQQWASGYHSGILPWLSGINAYASTSFI